MMSDERETYEVSYDGKTWMEVPGPAGPAWEMYPRRRLVLRRGTDVVAIREWLTVARPSPVC